MKNKQLRCGEDGKFMILIVADPQCENHEQWEEARAELETLVGRAKPDLVIIDGDMDTNNHIPREAWAHFISPLTAHAIPWATVNGNHDPFTEETYAMYTQYDECYNAVVIASDENFEAARPMNYALPIYAHGNDRVVFMIYALDTGDINENGWEGVTKKQISWYQKEADKRKRENGGVAVPALVCCHIPFAETKKMQVLCGLENEVGAVTSLKNDKGFFRALKDMGDVRIAVFGHSHTINHVGIYDGILLGYAGKLSSGSYHDDVCRGGRVVTFDMSAPEVVTTHWLASLPTACDQPTVSRDGLAREI